MYDPIYFFCPKAKKSVHGKRVTNQILNLDLQRIDSWRNWEGTYNVYETISRATRVLDDFDKWRLKIIMKISKRICNDKIWKLDTIILPSDPPFRGDVFMIFWVNSIIPLIFSDIIHPSHMPFLTPPPYSEYRILRPLDL